MRHRIMANSWRGMMSRHPRALGGLFAVYWLAMFLATHLEMPKEVELAPQNTDKAVHLVMYGGFAFLLASWRSAKAIWNSKLAWLIFAAAAIYAALDELLQIPIESRSADVWDFVMDLTGAALGLIVFGVFRRKFRTFWETDE
jgi:VanZ family protein